VVFRSDLDQLMDCKADVCLIPNLPYRFSMFSWVRNCYLITQYWMVPRRNWSWI